MEAKHNLWIGGHPGQPPERHVVLYAHGGLVGEDGGISIADRMIDWWCANNVYPVHIVWESDPITTIFSVLDHHQAGLPFGGWLDGAWEALDTALEHLGRNIRPLWEQMKANARAASDALRGGLPETEPGVTLFLDRLQVYRQKHPNDMKIHLVGHSAGSVVLASVVDRLAAMGIPIDSLQLMGGAIRVDDFVTSVVSKLAGAPGGNGALKRFVAYDLKDKNELDDTCPANPAVYHKSLLYFVARSLEASPSNFEVPMAGLSKDMSVAYGMPDGSQASLLNAIGGPGNLVVAPTIGGPADAHSQAHGHGDFDDDPDTMTSVILRIKATQNLGAVTAYPRGGMHLP